MTNPVLEFKDAIVRRGLRVIFENLNFTLNKGQNWAVVGFSGSGKTTFLQVIMGKVYINGKKIYNPCQTSKQIELIPSKPNFKNLYNLTSQFYYQQRYQSYESELSLTVEEHLAQWSEAKEDYWTKNKVVEVFQLDEMMDRHIIKLSNGETKRLLFAQALIKNPKILLMDNPLVGLDVQTKATFNQLLDEIIASGIQIIITTDINSIPPLITDVAILEKGGIAKKLKKHEIPHIHRLYEPYVPSVDIKLIDQLLVKKHPVYENLVKLNNVSVTYDGQTIIKHVSWKISSGERWHLRGANGAGKSTLLSLINSDNPQAYANDIILFDRNKKNQSIWEIKQKIGYVSPELFQNFPSYNSCAAIVESGLYETLGLFKPSVPENRKSALEWLHLLGIEEFEQSKLNEVSDSVKRLVLLARAMIKKPQLLILDEPCQGLDHEQKSRILKLIDEFCIYSNITVIYVSHNEKDIPDAINKTIKIQNGEIV